MSVSVYVTLEEIGTALFLYDKIRLYRSATKDGSYGLVATASLAAGAYHYSISDSSGTSNSWYKYTLYNSGTLVESDFSNIFRPEGTSRLRIRQRALADYRAGAVIKAVAGCTTELWKTDDYRVASELFRSGRHVGGWIVPTVTSQSGLLGATRHILTNTTPANGKLAVEAWPNASIAGDEAEIHWLVSPDEWNDAINRGLARYWYLDQVPIVGAADQYNYALSYLPWLRKQNIHGIWYTPEGGSTQAPYAGDGKWYRATDDQGWVSIDIYPPVEADQTLYLECSRPTAPLYADGDNPPSVLNEELCAALAYDEVLRMLVEPVTGGSQDRRSWATARKRHAAVLRKLLSEHRPRPRPFPPMSQYGPPVSPQPYKSR